MKTRTLSFLFVIISLFSFSAFAQELKVASELTPTGGWLNTDKPLSLKSLKGKVVMLDFWTYGCINCLHIIPDLKRLEAKFSKELVVIGVHSAKFENEKQTENIRKIILRYEIEHPVANDFDFKVWRSYDVQAWPTRILIDTEGNIRARISGEGSYDKIVQMIEQYADEARKKGKLNEQPIKLALENAKTIQTPLSFPGKVLADEKSERLFVADSNNNRIVIAKLDGTLIETFGSGKLGLVDGSKEIAAFNHPQGMAIDGDNLYVADTGNHTIRKINLVTKIVSTIAGTGKQNRYESEGGIAKKTPLSSPWDLQVIGRKLFIAIAGLHQIWSMDLDKQTVSVFAGSGNEVRQDGELLESGFSQPSGLLTFGNQLFVADSEANIIRSIDLSKKEVETIVGGDLFEFGDKDGKGDDVRLQHPLGLAKLGENILIADTYNHKIKLLDTKNRTVTTFLGSGKSGNADGKKPSFWEIGGLSVAGGKIFIADTNNNVIRVADIGTKEVSTLEIKGLTSPAKVAMSKTPITTTKR
jgi:DNA-binding beta-propeller fold protein YncE/peroxiredoxin